MTENEIDNDRIVLDEVTKTCDGRVSKLKLTENIVIVFPELKDFERGDVLDKDDKPLSVEVGEMTDRQISELRGDDNVDQEFHEVDDLEGDDVVERFVRVGEEEVAGTSDNGVSDLKGDDDVDHKFHESKDTEGDGVHERLDRLSSDEVTKTVDSAVTELNLVENVVQVCHESKGSEGDDVLENLVGPSSEEVSEVADGGTSELNLTENVAEVFHESTDPEVDDVVENLDEPSSDEVTKTADGAISELNVVENVVHVFHESKESAGDDGFEYPQEPPSEEVLNEAEVEIPVSKLEKNVNSNENQVIKNSDRFLSHEVTKTKDHGISELELVKNDVHIYHESKGSEGDDVFEEAMMEANFEEATDDNAEKLDHKEAIVNGDMNVEKPRGFDSPEVNGIHIEDNEAENFEEATETELPSEHQVEEQNTVEENIENLGAAIKVIDEDDNFKKVVPNEVTGNEEENVAEVSATTVDRVTKPASAGEENSNVRSDILAREKSENEVSGEVAQETESCEKILRQDDQGRETENTVVKDLSSVESSTTEIDNKIKDDLDESQGKGGLTSQSQPTKENVGGASVGPEKPKEKQTQEGQQKPAYVSTEQSTKPSLAKVREVQPAVEPSQPLPPSRPAGLGGAAPLLDPAPRASQQSRVNGAVPQRQAQLVEDNMNSEAEENDETREKLQMIRVKFLRLAHRLGQTPHNVVVAQVLYRLGLAEQLRGRNTGRVGAFSFDRASAMAEQLEAAHQEPLDFSCTIMVLGKTGVGKSATINSIFDEVKFSTDAFEMGTKNVQDVVGTVQGIKVRVIDTPGLLPCSADQRHNEKILHSVKRFIKKTPPDIVLYLDRLDMQSRDFGDMPLLRTITEIFGPSIWFNAIVVLTHAASAPPDGPNGIASSYEMFVTQRSNVVQQAVRQAAGDMRLMNPVSLVENHSACRTNRAGQRVLPNGQVWKPHLLLLSFASKILAEANTLLKLQDSPPGKPFATRQKAPPLPFLLSSLIQSRPQLKLPEEQLGDEDELEDDLDDLSDSDNEADNYDELPSFKPLTKVQLAKLSKSQKKAYFDELEYREKLYMKKQLKEERKRRKLLKKMAASAKDLPPDYNDIAEEESGGAASVPVPMPDYALPTSFDSDNPTHRYRFLDNSNQWLVRPVLETHGWDHDVGYEGINVERVFVVKEKVPVSFSGQVTKDKKEANLQMELASSIKHGEGKATSVGFDMQTLGKEMAYTLRSETRFCNFRRNQTAAGLSVTYLGDALTAGVKLEDRLIANKRFRLVLTGGAMTGRGDVAYGGSLEATLRDKDYPLGRTLTTFGLSVMDWHGDLAIGGNLQSQIPIGRSTNVIARANLNNRGAGQISIRLNSSEQLQIALVALLPLFRKIHAHYQQMMIGE
ncbi:hypothetical protein GIB67_007944 [Kingdonia uniflora]|uniref:AIG1-type G domain-containing protein n=1 Tax=Kingdonia uniflora TaxID=39325 RepID=A0A7J7L9B0_9MAGN|nr:hypothetical protein GIB67_007944 [Kingdonia uniflora]